MYIYAHTLTYIHTRLGRTCPPLIDDPAAFDPHGPPVSAGGSRGPQFWLQPPHPVEG